MSILKITGSSILFDAGMTVGDFGRVVILVFPGAPVWKWISTSSGII
jgi:hypothetical protein